jgi:hypothetical protein
MNFSLSDEQELLRTSVHTLLSKECPASVVRASIEDRHAADTLDGHLSSWTALASGPSVDLCLCCEELGSVAAPGTFYVTAALFAPLLEAIDHPLAAATLDGQIRGTVAIADRSGNWNPHSDPEKYFVLEPTLAEHVAVVSQNGDAFTVAVLENPLMSPIATLDLTREFGILDSAGIDAVAIDESAVRTVLDRATLALAADMVGTARRILSMTIEYAKQRVQFDKPIGSFQAVKHKLANMGLACERAWSAVYYAAMCLDDHDMESSTAVHVAKASAGHAAKLCAKDGLQIHGGVGYTWDCDLHLFIRRVYGSESTLGTAEWHEDALGLDLLP